MSTIYEFKPKDDESFPPYISFARHNADGDVLVTLRGHHHDWGQITIPFEEVRTMVAVLYDYQLLHRLGALIPGAKTYTVKINAQTHLIVQDTLDYDQIITLAGVRWGSTVVVHPPQRKGFTVVPKGVVKLEDGMRIEAAFTGAA